MSEAMSQHNLGARLAAYPRHPEAIPVVGVIDGVPMILGNARTTTGAKMMGYVYCIQARTASLQAASPDGQIWRQFFLLREAT